jgi:diacylglycerol kinase (ATP)
MEEHMSGIGVLLNRNAGKRLRRHAISEAGLRSLLGNGDLLEATSTIDQIEAVARKFRDQQIDVLGICGGDGSNHYVLTSFIRAYQEKPLPKIALLCGGTHNAHAASIGLKGQPEDLLCALVRNHQDGKPFRLAQRNLLRVDDGKSIHHGFSMATGFMYRFYQEINLRQRESPIKVVGSLASWIGSWAVRGKKVRNMFQLEPAKVFVSGVRQPWDQINGISASGVERLGMGFVPYPRANETPTTFQASVVRVKPSTFIRLMWYYRRGTIPEHRDINVSITDQFLLEMEQPISYVLDGEIYHGGNRLQINTGPRLQLIL